MKGKDFLQLIKFGITLMVVVSTAVGMLLAAESPLPWTLWAKTLGGTALVSAGALALNQVLERNLDSLMRRTQSRPIPSGRVAARVAAIMGGGLIVIGTVLLWFGVQPLTAALGLATATSYLLVYTPLKRVSSLSTIVGAIPGAVPPMMGWSAVTGGLELPAWILFAILFLWQFPHFLAIAWLYRDDYEQGGFPMLSVSDLGGRKTGRQTLLYTAALVPVSLLPGAVGLTGTLYLLGAVVGGVAFFWVAARFALERDRARARAVLLVSILYQPLVLGALALDRLWGGA